MANGSMHQVAVVTETAAGTTPAAPQFKTMRFGDFSLDITKDTFVASDYASDRQVRGVRTGATKVAGEAPFKLSYGSFDDLLAAALCGAWDTGHPAAGTDRLVDGVVRTYSTFERLFSDMTGTGVKKYQRGRGCEINGLKMKMTANAVVDCSFSIIGRDLVLDDAAVTSAHYDAASTTAELDNFTGVLKENGSVISSISEMSLEVANGINPLFALCSQTAVDTDIGVSSIKGSITAYFWTTTLLEKFLNETPTSLEMTFPDKAGNSLKLILPNVLYTGGTTAIKGPGTIPIVLPFQAIYDPTYGGSIVLQRTPVVVTP